MGLEDIDEDDVPPVPKPPTTCGKQQQPTTSTGVNFDDLFGGAGQTVMSPGAPAITTPPVVSGNTKKSANGSGSSGLDFLDDCFSGQPAAAAPAPTSPSAAFSQQQPGPPISTGSPFENLGRASPAQQPTIDPFADLLGGGGAAAGTASGSTTPTVVPPPLQRPTTQSPAPPQSPSAVVGGEKGSSLIDFSRPTASKQHERSEMDLIDELMSGKKKNTGGGATLGSIAGATKTSSQARYNPHLLQLMSYYDILGVPKTASEDEIHRAYKKKSIDLHPDRQHGKSQQQSEEEATVYKLMTTAHETLMDAPKRAEYDKGLSSAEARPNWLHHV